jgi:putative spermidine/putrescine transport system substrate-binding protein
MPRSSDENGARGRNRRAFLKTAGAAGVLGLAGCTGAGPGGSTGGNEATPTNNDPLKVGVYGGVFKETLDSSLVNPFQEETGIPTTSTPQSVGDAMNKLKQSVDAGEAPVDVVVVAPDARIRGQNLGTWLNYSPDAISRADAVVDDLLDTTEDGEVVGVGGFGWFLNILSNTEVLDEPLNSWEAFWDPQYEGLLSANRLPGDGFLMDIVVNTFDEFDESYFESEDGLTQLMEKVAEINPQISNWWTQEAEAQQPLREGNIGATQMYNDVSLVMKNKGAPVEVLFPEEGGVMNFGSWTIVQTTEYPEAAKQFVDYAVRPEVQKGITESLFTAPTIKEGELDLSGDMYETVYGPGPDAAIRPNNRLYIEKEQFINEQWQQTVLN